MRKLSDDSPNDVPEPADPRNQGRWLVGTPLRDAAVDPKESDFLAPKNAGKANPHGPDVVSPEVHASQGVRPVKGGDVHTDDVEAQDAAETDHAEAVQEGGAVVEKPGGSASKADWTDYALANGKTEEDLDGLTRDQIRDLFTEPAE